MKKLLSFLLVALAFSASAFDFRVDQLINGQYLVVSNNSTILYNTTNVFWIDGNNVGRWSATISNVVATTGLTNSSTGYTNFVPAQFFWTNGGPYLSAYPIAGGVVTNGNSAINGFPWSDGVVWTDGYGLANNPNVSIAVTTVGVGSRAAAVAGAPTNTLTLTFAKVPDGVNASSGLGNDQFIFAFSASAGTNTTFTTNMQSAVWTGTKNLRLLSIASSNVTSGTNCVVSEIAICGFH